MPGIWERVKSSAADRLSSHMVDAALTLYSAGNFTSQQVLDGINGQLASALAGVEVTDLSNIRAAMDAISQTANKLVYVGKVRAAFLAGEVGAITESQFRAILGIV